MGKVSKTVRLSMNVGVGTESRVPTFWVFSAWQGKGIAKMPVAGCYTEDQAHEYAKGIGGYYVNMSIKAVK